MAAIEAWPYTARYSSFISYLLYTQCAVAAAVRSGDGMEWKEYKLTMVVTDIKMSYYISATAAAGDYPYLYITTERLVQSSVWRSVGKTCVVSYRDVTIVCDCYNYERRHLTAWSVFR